MPNALTPNLVLAIATDQFQAIWKLSRTMLVAGWKYLASGNGQASGTVNLAQSGTAASISAFSANVQTFTGMSGFTQGAVGQYITISNANTAGNNGTFLILSVVSATSITVYNTTGTSTDTNNGSLHWSVLKSAATDLWAVDGAVHLQSASRGTGTGTGVTIAAASASTGQATITGVTSFSQNLSPGDYLNITGSGVVTGPGPNGTNNGNYRIVSATAAGTSVTIYAPGMVAETSNSSLTVQEQFGGADASIGTFTQGTLLNLTTSSFTGFTSADVGKFITLLNPNSAANNGSWLIVGFVSSNHVTIYNPAGVANDTNATIQWVMTDPKQQSYPGSSAANYIQFQSGGGAWILFQGPSTLKIPIGNNAPTGTFIKGENVTQSSTGAQGELLGIIVDTTGATGYLVISPRVPGTGSSGFSGGLWGWNNSTTDTVTGALSGATVTSTAGPPIHYIRETLIWKNFSNSGFITHQVIDQNPATESATTATTGRLSTMANTLSQVTSVLAPGQSTGGSPTTNGFPTTGTYQVIGAGGNGTNTTNWGFWAVQQPTGPGRAHLIAANCIAQQGVSEDGTWAYLQSCSSIGYQCLSYQRMDNQEDGDLDPYLHQGHWAGTINTATSYRVSDTAGVAGTGSGTDNMCLNNAWIDASTTGHGLKGFRRRGLSGETFNIFSPAILFDTGNATFVLQVNAGNPDQVGSLPPGVTSYVRDVLWAYLTPYTNQLATGRMRKGTLRWLQLVQQANVHTTLDNLTWLVLSPQAGSAQFVIGPWDGVTQPTF